MRKIINLVIALLLLSYVLADTLLDNAQYEGLTKTTKGDYVLKDGSLTINGIKSIFLGSWSVNPSQEYVSMTATTDAKLNNQFIGKGSVVTIGKDGQTTNADVKNGKGDYEFENIGLENVAGSFVYSKFEGFKNLPKNALLNFNNPLGKIKIESSSDIEFKGSLITLKKGELSIGDVKIRDLGKPVDISFDQRVIASDNVVNIIKGQNLFKPFQKEDIIKAKVKGDVGISHGAVSVAIVNSRPKGVPDINFDYKSSSFDKPFLLETNSGVLSDQFNYAYSDPNEGVLVWDGNRDILNEKIVASIKNPVAVVWNKGIIENTYSKIYRDGLNSILRFSGVSPEFSNKANKIIGTNELKDATSVLYNEFNIENLYINTGVYRKGEELYLINEFREKTLGLFKTIASNRLKEGAEEFAARIIEQVKSLNTGVTDTDINKFKKGLEDKFFSEQGNFWLLMKSDPKRNEIIIVMKNRKGEETIFQQTIKGTVPNLENLKKAFKR